jgi:ABC-type Fe3+-hydroxamate transport system substrate-binding protein
MARVTSELLQHSFELSGRPKRVVSLLSAATETIDALGLGETIAGVSEYCHRYVDTSAPTVGAYTSADLDGIAAIGPDLVLVTSGVQSALGRRLARAGHPVYALPLPSSIHGVFENILTVAALLDAMEKGRTLVESLNRRLRALDDRTRRSTYVEVWFGKHLRTIGGRTFIADIVDIAGGDALFASSRGAYLKPDFAAVAAATPEVMVALSEPEHPVDFRQAIRERGWTFGPHLIVSTVAKGNNIIQDGPSIVDTIEWLADRFDAAGS